MLGFVVQHLVVDLVGENDQLVLARQVDDLLQHGNRVQRAGGIVRVDDDDGFRVRRDLAAHVLDVGIPLVLLIAHIMHGIAARQADGGRPQRIVGRRHQHFVATVEQGVHRHDDQFGRAIAQVNVVDGDAGDILALRVMHDGLARREHAFRIRIAGRVLQIEHHVAHDFIGRIEAEYGQIADIELGDLVAFFFHLPGFFQDRAADVVADVRQFIRFLNRSQNKSLS